MENVAQKNEKSIPGAIKIDEKEAVSMIDYNNHKTNNHERKQPTWKMQRKKSKSQSLEL